MVLKNKVGGSEFPKPGELILAKPTGIACGADGRIYISDRAQKSFYSGPER